MPPQLSPQAGIDSADYDTSRDVINHAAELLSVPRSDLDHSDSGGSPVKRFGFHNLRHSLSTALMTGEKEDPRTVQDMLRHSKVATSLELYTQSTMEQRIAAQEKYLHRILPQSELVKLNGTKNGTGFTGGPLQGYDS